MVTQEPLYKLSAKQVTEKIQAGSLTVEEYAKALLDRIEEREPTVNAWAYLPRDLVLKNARELDQTPPEKRGPLFGVAFGIKDIIYTKDMPTQHNSPIYKDDFPKLDAAPVISLRNQGALILGKTTTTEFASVFEGNKTSNAHDKNRTPGGSSSGSAPAVADYHVPIALGTQTFGSTIRPGSFNGVYSMKTTWGAISREGLKMWSVTCDTFGMFARSADDLDLVVKAFGLQDDEPVPNYISDKSNIRIGICKTPLWDEKAGPGTKKAMEDAIQALHKAGINTENVDLPKEFDQVPTLHKIILAGEGKAAFHGDYHKCKDLLPKTLVGLVQNSDNYSRKDLLNAYDKVAQLRPEIDQIAGKYTALLAPSAPDIAPLGLKWTGDASLNGMWTVLHVPIINIPGFKGENGMPIGLSLIKPRYQDCSLIALSKLIGEIFVKG